MLLEISDAELAEIGAILRESRGMDITTRKSDCIRRRILLRMRVTHCPDVARYCIQLKQSEQELDLLLKMLTIHVSQFFRNPSMFEKLKSAVFPDLFAAAASQSYDGFQIFSLGCAGGEEPYSLAIMLKEYFSRELQQTDIKITAVDVDVHTLTAAQKAEFGEDKLKNVPRWLKQRYFKPCRPGYCLNPEIRSMVSFLQGDITEIVHQPVASLVLCRNTLIYFNRPAQEQILSRIADLLVTGGILVLGKSETMVGEIRSRFEPVCRVERIYRKIF